MHQAQPLRVFVTVKATSDYYRKAWSAPHDVVEAALSALSSASADVHPEQAPSAQLVAILNFDSKARLVFDMFYASYDSKTAYLPGHDDDLRVWVVTVGKGTETDMIKVSLATKGTGIMINREVRRIHGSNTLEARPPFREDYTNDKAPVSINPRCPGGITD
ncbi:hypothetical protein SODALDRAFT_324783 [Sodiomyces alkalinus F11]|uniref:Uncharacterized protein n=1 Tax=Sodiomyces alkalinus (strain CBS 110278 / VKM F-3762 / F11) TaxID=1314773 RepID=A0A3N2PRN2_SODAK|nr:hypothetical protein SODALDRAFT_324783 [Sodiomyces alkalinus F11]ROT37130.1 hypothetical protein SODALDRAFT_324783 [Sodiomyces alkalinus F11]